MPTERSDPVYRRTMARRSIRYGSHRSQVADLWRPEQEADARLPVVVLIHGGFWRAPYTKMLMTPLAKAVARRGWMAWNVEYRRLGVFAGGGGWPETLFDIAASIDHLATIENADLGRVVICGHSAGGQLALWAAARSQLRAGSPGADPQVGIRGSVSLAGLVNLREADRLGLGADAVAKFLQGHWAQQEERYRHASPAELAPLGVPQALIHGVDDTTVPPSMSRNYQVQASAAGDDARYVAVADTAHRDLIDPSGPGWAAAVAELERFIG